MGAAGDIDGFLGQIRQAAAVLAAGQAKRPMKVRMHPLDIAKIQKAHPSSIATVLGIPLEMDCAVQRGVPEVEYKE